LKTKGWGGNGDLRFYYPRAGEMALSVRHLSTIIQVRKEKEAAHQKKTTPEQDQALRRLSPVFLDLFRGFEVRLVLECYAPIRSAGFGYRGRRAQVRRLDLLHFNDKYLDRYGNGFLKNEELLLNLLRGKWGARNIVDHTSKFPMNNTLPVFLAWGSKRAGLGLNNETYRSHGNFKWKISNELFFPPSKQLFDKFFEGKTLNYSIRKAPQLEKAEFERIGAGKKENGDAKEDGVRKETP